MHPYTAYGRRRSRPRHWCLPIYCCCVGDSFLLHHLADQARSALSKAGFQVIHIDRNHYYGGDEASLTVDELVQWAQERADPSHPQHERFTSMTYTPTLPARSRQFSISLIPTVIASTGPFIDTLIASGVSRYGGFKLLERVALFDRPGGVQMVPSGKEDIFRSKELSLIEKRRLMRFLMFAGSEFEGKNELQGREEAPFFTYLRDVFSLDEKSARAITYALCFCNFASGIPSSVLLN